MMVEDANCQGNDPAQRPRYSLDELLAQCDPSAEMSAEDGAWLNDPPAGKEKL
jgi:antitoxin ChpS